MIEINVQDEFHYLFILSIIDICLYLAVCVNSERTLPRAIFAANAALIVQWWLQSCFTSDDWPRGWYSNNVILFMFTMFMFFIMASLWATVFLVLGLMFIDPVWEHIRIQIELLMQTTIGFAVSSSSHGWIFWGFTSFLVFCGIVAWFSEIRIIKRALLHFALSTRFVTSMKALFISKGTIVCSVAAGSRMCPFWFDSTQWWLTIGAIAVRFALAELIGRVLVKSHQTYKPVATDAEPEPATPTKRKADNVYIPVRLLKKPQRLNFRRTQDVS
jgi:hypothetical protein